MIPSYLLRNDSTMLNQTFFKYIMLVLKLPKVYIFLHVLMLHFDLLKDCFLCINWNKNVIIMTEVIIKDLDYWKLVLNLF